MAIGKEKKGHGEKKKGRSKTSEVQSLEPSADSLESPNCLSSNPADEALITQRSGPDCRVIDTTKCAEVFRAAYGLWEHCFISLTEYTLLRACVHNAVALSLSPDLFVDDESVSPWTLSNPYPALAPHDLSPTPTQLCTPHHPYLDVIALPTFRDNVLLACLEEGVEAQLCYELHLGSFIIWGSQPWNAMGMSSETRYMDGTDGVFKNQHGR